MCNKGKIPGFDQQDKKKRSKSISSQKKQLTSNDRLIMRVLLAICIVFERRILFRPTRQCIAKEWEWIRQGVGKISEISKFLLRREAWSMVVVSDGGDFYRRKVLFGR